MQSSIHLDYVHFGANCAIGIVPALRCHNVSRWSHFGNNRSLISFTILVCANFVPMLQKESTATYLGHGTGCRIRGIFDAILFCINYQLQTYYKASFSLFSLISKKRGGQGVRIIGGGAAWRNRKQSFSHR